MALDTAQKRRSMVSFGGALYGERVPEATDFDSAADRGAEMWMYAGIAPDGGGSPGGDPAPSVELSFRSTPRLFGPRRVATVVP